MRAERGRGVEFDERLRFIDVASGLAFLYMDLERLAAAPLAAELERAYVEQSGDEEVRKLLPFFACYRAWVRAKVACLRLAQVDEDDPRRPVLLSEARTLAALSLRFVWRARLPVVLVFCGVGASGKSMLAEEISRRSGLPHLSSDVIRKGLAGIPVKKRGPSGIYEAPSTMLTYDDLLVEGARTGRLSRRSSDRCHLRPKEKSAGTGRRRPTQRRARSLL